MTIAPANVRDVLPLFKSSPLWFHHVICVVGRLALTRIAPFILNFEAIAILLVSVNADRFDPGQLVGHVLNPAKI